MFEILARVVLVALSLLLLAAAVIKLRHLPVYLAQSEAWRILPRGPARAAALALTLVELLLGVAGIAAAVAGRGTWLLAVAIATLFVGFALAQAMILGRTRSAPCGCGVWHGDISRVSIVRSGVFAMLAGAVALAV